MNQDLLHEVVALLSRRRSDTALIGAIALAAHGIVRATLDIDLLAADAALLTENAWVELSSLGAEVEIRRGDFDDPLAGVVRITREGQAPVDVVVGKHRFMEQVLARRTTLVLGGRTIPVVDAPDLVILKVFAGGPQDLLDASLLLAGDEGHRIRAGVEGRLSSLPDSLQEPVRNLLARAATA